MGLLAAIGGLLGGVKASTLGSAVAGAGLDLAKNQIGKNRDFKRMREMGLTPQEMVGASGIGGVGDGATQVLGNNAGQLAVQKKQQEYEAEQRNLDRAVALSGQQTQLETARTSAQAILGSAQMSAGASRYASDNQRANVLDQLAQNKSVTIAQANKIDAETTQVMQDTDFKRVLHDERWPRLFSTMSADNVVGSALAVLKGVPIEEVLKGTADPDNPGLQAFLDAVKSRQSRIDIETEGVTSIITDALDSIFNP